VIAYPLAYYFLAKHRQSHPLGQEPTQH